MTTTLPRSLPPALAPLEGKDASIPRRPDLREATELTSAGPPSALPRRSSPPMGSSRGTYPTPRPLPARCRTYIAAHWRRHVSILVAQHEARDHFANERTFLAAQRTSLAFAVLGTVVAQLLRLEHAPNPNPRLGFYALGVPLACLCIGSAMLVAVLAAVRFLRLQAALGRGKARAGGWEVYAMMGMGMLVNLVAFVLVVTVDVSKAATVRSGL